MLQKPPMGFLAFTLFLSLSGPSARAISPCLVPGEKIETIMGHGEEMPPGVRRIPVRRRQRLLDFIASRDGNHEPFPIVSYSEWHQVSKVTGSMDIRLARLGGFLDQVGESRYARRSGQSPGGQGWDIFHEYGREADDSVALLLDMFRVFRYNSFTLRKAGETLELAHSITTRDNLQQVALEGVVTGVLRRDDRWNYHFLIPPKPYSGRENRMALKLQEAGVPLEIWRKALELKEYDLDHLLKVFKHTGVNHPVTNREIIHLTAIDASNAHSMINEAISFGLMARVPGTQGQYIFVGEGGIFSEQTKDILPPLLEERGVDPKVWERAPLIGPVFYHRLVELFRDCGGLSCSPTGDTRKVRRLAFLAGVMERGSSGFIDQFRKTLGPRDWELIREYDPEGTGISGVLRDILRVMADRGEVTRRDLIRRLGASSRMAYRQALRAGHLVGILKVEKRGTKYVYTSALPQKKKTPTPRPDKRSRRSSSGDDDVIGDIPENSREILEREGPVFYGRLDRANIPRALWAKAHGLSPPVLRKLMRIVMEGRAHESFRARDREMIIPLFHGHCSSGQWGRVYIGPGRRAPGNGPLR